MRLLMHNFLSSKFLKGVQTGYPLNLVVTQVDVKEHEFNESFIKRMLGKIEYHALKSAADQCGYGSELPEGEVDPSWQENEDILKKIHKVLMEVDVVEGQLECPETGRKFEIKNGIPNMLANEDEV